MDEGTLRRQALELLENRGGHLGGFFEETPLGAGGHGHPKVTLQLGDPVHGDTGAVAQDGQEAAHTSIVLTLGGFGGYRRGKHFGASAATELLQVKKGGRKARLGHDEKKASGFPQAIEFTHGTGGTEIAGVQVGMSHRDVARAGIVFRAVASVPRSLLLFAIAGR